MSDSNGAVGFFWIDTTKYSNGPHTIGWSVTDSGGSAEGIGSRYFTVQNGSSRVGLQVTHPSLIGYADELRDAPPSYAPIYARRGYAPDVPLEFVPIGSQGVRQVTIEPVGCLALHLGAERGVSYIGYLQVGNELQPLPVGSTLDSDGGVFYWQPGVGFTGIFDLRFVRWHERGNRERVPLRVVIGSPLRY